MQLWVDGGLEVAVWEDGDTPIQHTKPEKMVI